MAKYKLEYIWLDGYEPVPNLRGKTQDQGVRQLPDARGAPDVGLRRQLDPAGRGQQLGLHAASRSPSIPDPTRIERRARDVRGDAARRDAASVATAARRSRTIPTRGSGSSRSTSSTGRRAARLPARGLPGPAGRVLHRRRLQERRRHRARDRRQAPRPLPRGRHQPRGHQRRGGEGPVGVPDLRQGLEDGRRRDLDRPLPAAAPLREVRRRRELPSASRSAWTSTGTAPACTRTSRRSTCARSAARSTSRR